MDNQRLHIATQALTGLLSSQDPEKGWDLDTLAILSLKIADNLIRFSRMETLPDLLPAKPDAKGEQPAKK